MSMSANATFVPASSVAVNAGTQFQVRASVPGGSIFQTWTGDVSFLATHGSPTVVTAAKNMSLGATVIAQSYTLTVNLEGGTQAAYTKTVSRGTTLGLSEVGAFASPGYSFVRWAGPDITGLVSKAASATADPAATITMNSDKQLTALFVPSFTLSVSADQGGTVNPYGVVSRQAGTRVTLSPIPAPGYAFSGWSGANATDLDFASSLVLDGNKAIHAHFVETMFTLTITTTNGKEPSVTYTYGANTLVNLTAALVSGLAAEGYTFERWSGPDANLLSAPTRADGTLLLTRNALIHLNFAAALPLSISASEGGTITVEKLPPTP